MINHHAGVVAPLRRLTRRRVCWIETAIACLVISQGLAAATTPAKPIASAYAQLTNKEPNASQALPGRLSAIKAEQPGEEKSRLLYALFQHIKASPLSRRDWERLKGMLPALLNTGEDGRVVANAFLVSSLVLSESEQMALMTSWLRHNSRLYSAGDRLLIEKTIHLLLFERLVNAKPSADLTEESALVALLNKERLMESISVYLRDFPQEKLTKPTRQFLRRFLAQPASDWFRRDGLFKAHYRVTIWAAAMLKLSAQPREEAFFQLAAGIGDPVVLSLLAAGNPSFLATDAQKQRFLSHLKATLRVKNRLKNDEKALLHQMMGGLRNHSPGKRKNTP